MWKPVITTIVTYWMAMSSSSAFVVMPPAHQCMCRSSRYLSRCQNSVDLKSTEKDEEALNDNNEGEDDDDDWILGDEELEILFEGDEEDDNEDEEGRTVSTSDSEPRELDNMELAWRHAGKPLLRIGAKGASDSHGNSLRELLEAHTAVKVKLNTRKFETLEGGFEVLKMLAEDSGAPPGIELIQARERDSIIMCALPGTMEKIINGEFPPPQAEESDEAASYNET